MATPIVSKDLQDELDRIQTELRVQEAKLPGANPDERSQIASKINRLRLDEHTIGVAIAKQRPELAPKAAGQLPAPIPVPLPFFPTIVGVERTQATQVFPFNGKGAAPGAPNSVPMIAGKATLLRVYVDCFQPGGVTGLLTYDSDKPADKQTIIPPTPGQPFVQAQPRASIDRAQLADTLNFVIPAGLCEGERAFSVSIGTGTEPPYIETAPNRVMPNPNSNFSATDQQDSTIGFEPLSQPLIYGVLVHYTGPDTNGNQQDFGTATLANLAQTLYQVQRLWPVSGFTIGDHRTIDFTPPAGSNGMDQAAWNALLAEIDTFGEDHYYALVPGSTQTPTGTVYALSDNTIGLGEMPGKAAAGFDNLSYDPAAQELAHTLGRLHAKCYNPNTALDPNYPTYGSYPEGSIGEVGADPLFLQAFDPAGTYDLMSDCRPYWVSPYTYLALIDGIKQTWPILG